jgi:hypothetical protein
MFSDDGAILKSQIIRGALRLFGLLKIDGRRQLAVTSHCVHTFFDACLREDVVFPVEIESPTFPEIQPLGAIAKK